MPESMERIGVLKATGINAGTEGRYNGWKGRVSSLTIFGDRVRVVWQYSNKRR
jgi:hypothetical protein